jgi:flavin reductase (DIM6/NTAB) family NADH-FMN oxidoreductase RutF
MLGSEDQVMPEFEQSELTERENARIIKTAVNPRPIAWISTRGTDGTDNLAPYSSYNYVSSAHPVVLFNSPNEANGGLKDTARNAVETGEFAVNVVTEPDIERMDHSSEPVPVGESEFDSVGTERAPCRQIDAPRVSDAPITMECTLYDSHEIHDRLMILGEVVHFHIDASVMTDGKVDQRKVPTVGRLGGPFYTVSEPVEFQRQF